MRGESPRVVAALVGLFVAVPLSVVCLWKICPGVVRVLVGDGRVLRFLGRLLVVYAASVAIFGGFYAATEIANSSPWVHTLMSAVWPCLLPMFVLNVAGLCLLSLLLLLWVVRLVVKVLSVVCWRVVEYDRGVFAALILVATVGLGLYRVFLTGA